MAERVQLAREQDVVRRIWRKDGTLWAAPGTPELEDRLGWLTIPRSCSSSCRTSRRSPPSCATRASRTSCCSAWAARASPPRSSAAPRRRPRARCGCTCSTPPSRSRWRPWRGAVDPATTLFIVSSKSGGTIEPNALLAYFRGRQPDPRHFVAITDPGTSMAKLAESEGFRRTFLSDPEIGGRYSALSPFGIVPGDAGRRRRAGRARGRARWRWRTASCPRATPACGSAPRWASSPGAGATSSPSSSIRRCRRSGCGRSSSWRSRRASRRAASCPIADEPLVDPPALRARPGLPPPARRRRARPAARGGDARPGQGRARDDRLTAGGGERPRPDLLRRRVRHGGGRVGAGDQPVRPAQRAGGQGQHDARPERGRAGRPAGRARSRSS